MRIILAGITLSAACTAVLGQSDWTWRNPTPTGNLLTSVTWTGEHFVAVGHPRTVLTSPDGIDWSFGMAPAAMETPDFVVWGGGKLVAGGGNLKALFTSNDGKSWTPRSTGTHHGLRSAAWTGSRWVAVGVWGTILNSADGVEWSVVESGTEKHLHAIAWNGSILVAAGDTILTSSDGETWSGTAKEPGTLVSLVWADTQFVAGGNGFAMVSKNGTDWSRIDMAGFGNSKAMLHTGTRLVATTDGGANDEHVITSMNGRTWARSNSKTTKPLNSMAWSGKMAVVVGEGGAIITSPDGLAWTLRTARKTTEASDALRSVIWANGGLLAVGTQDWGIARGILTSQDAHSWTIRTSGTEENLHSVIWAGSQYVAVGSRKTYCSFIGCQFGAAVVVSPDGVNWTRSTLPDTISPLNSVTWTGSLLVAVGNAGTLLTSPDGIEWTKRISPTANHYNSVAWTGNLLVAVANAWHHDGTIATSPDGINWTLLADPKPDMKFVTWAGGQLVAGGTYGQLFTSPDGVTWTQRKSGTVNFTLTSAAWTGRQWVLGGEWGYLATSPDGVNWNAKVTGTLSHFNSVAWTGTVLVAVGSDGAILTSPQDAVTRAGPPVPRPDGIAIQRDFAQLSVLLPPSLHGKPLCATLYGITGRKVLTVLETPLEGKIRLPLERIDRGIHLLKVAAPGFGHTQTIYLTR